MGQGGGGIEVGKNDGLVLAAEDICAFGHEVHTAEHDVTSLGLRSLEGELEGVTAEIGELDDFVALVVMAQNNDVSAQAGFRGSDAVVEGVVRHKKVRIEVAAYTGLDFRRADGGRLVSADEGARNGY